MFIFNRTRRTSEYEVGNQYTILTSIRFLVVLSFSLLSLFNLLYLPKSNVVEGSRSAARRTHQSR